MIRTHNKPTHSERPIDAVVVGGGISGLVAAWELARSGTRVTLLEASERFGGCVGSHIVAGLTLDSGAESFATRTSAVAVLAAELGLSSHIVPPRPGGAWVQLPEGPRELPKTGVLGIPANPWDPEVRRTLGLLGSMRASLDRYFPASVGTSAEVTSVASLVRARMGRRVLQRLVAPVVGGVHSADPEGLDVDMVAPGLRAELRRQGSLAAAVAAQRSGKGQPAPAVTDSDQDGPGAPGPSGQQAGRQLAKAGSAVAGLSGGMHTLVTALVAELRKLGVELLAGVRADAVRRDGAAWVVATRDRNFQAERLVVALDGPAAVNLLSPALPDLASLKPAEGPRIALVTLVVDFPELDRRPRGTGILVAPQSPGIAAKALTHATAKWDWLASEAGPGTHVLRLSYGRAGDGSAGHQTDIELRDVALQDASALLGVAVTGEDVLGWDVVRWNGALPFAAVGHKRRVMDVRDVIASVPGLVVVGGWLAGNGLAAVVEDTRSQMQRVIEAASA